MQSPNDQRQDPGPEAQPDGTAPSMPSLIMSCLRNYRDLSSSTFSLVLAETKLAASSFLFLLGVTVFAAFVAVGLWACLLAFVAIALSAAGLGAIWIALLGIVLHLALLLLLVKPSKSALENMSFTASRQILSPPAAEPDHHASAQPDQVPRSSPARKHVH